MKTKKTISKILKYQQLIKACVIAVALHRALLQITSLRFSTGVFKTKFDISYVTRNAFCLILFIYFLTSVKIVLKIFRVLN